MLRSLLRIEHGQGGRGGGVMVIQKIAFKAKKPVCHITKLPIQSPPLSLSESNPLPLKNFMSGKINCAIKLCSVVCQVTAAELARISHQGPILSYRIMKVVKPLWARATHPPPPPPPLKLLVNKLLGT